MRRCAGWLLIETLVALLVLSVGLLGASALLLQAVRDEATAQRILIANQLVADMAERIRAHGGSEADDLATFAASARERFTRLLPEATVSSAPATGPATTASYLISLRWREAGAGTDVEISTLVLARSPVAG